MSGLQFKVWVDGGEVRAHIDAARSIISAYPQYGYVNFQ